MTSQTATSTDRSLRGSADALDTLALVLGDTYSTLRVGRVLVAGDRVSITLDGLKAARALAAALGFDPDRPTIQPGGLVHEWSGRVADLDVTIYGRRDDAAALRWWEDGAKEAARFARLAAVPAQVPDRLVADVLDATGVEMRGTYRHVREHCTRLVEARTVNAVAVAVARADVRSYLQVMDELGFYGPDDAEAADAAFLVVFGESR